MTKKARYICIEGGEGYGKTTQALKLAQYLRDRGFKVLETKEPGTKHLPVTMVLRNIMLNNDFDKELTPTAREFISQAIRSVHLEKLVYPALTEYDFIVQDRGILSGLAYGDACGNVDETLITLAQIVTTGGLPPSVYDCHIKPLYDDIVLLYDDVDKCLARTKDREQEFKNGDAMESRGSDFLHKVAKNFDSYSNELFYNVTKKICVTGNDIDTVFYDILTALNLH
jgi:dTMP kinase